MTTPTEAAAPQPQLKNIPAAIGAEFAGGIYAGIVRGLNGQPDYHLILLSGDVKQDWAAAMVWAASIDGDLPTRPEQALLFANLPEKFQQTWYWSNTQHADYSDYAWVQFFDNGNQTSYGFKSYSGRARAVRRLPI